MPILFYLFIMLVKYCYNDINVINEEGHKAQTSSYSCPYTHTHAHIQTYINIQTVIT